MSPDRDPGRFEEDGRDVDVDEYHDDAPRSIFSALWFRALIAVLVLGVLAAVAVPYVLDFATTPALKAPAKPVAMAPSPPATSPSAPTATAAPVAPAATGRSPAAPAAPSRAPARAEPVPASVAKPAPPKPVTTKPATMVARAVETPKQAPKAVGPYWVQVGAFKDVETAKKLAGRLREQGLRVEESTMVTSRPSAASSTGPSSADRYDVVVSGASAADLDAKLAPKGLTGEATATGIRVRPSMALRDAVSLSRDLADAGLSVQVRRVGGPAPSPAPVAASSAEVTLHRVRVGGFADRAAAVAALKPLEDKGFKPFIGRGNE